jgi:ATP-dependent Clp protease ATP-binding subunit ClpC
LGFVENETYEQDFSEMKDKVIDEVKKVFRPEFINRVDEIIVFHKLTKEHIEQIIEILLRDIRARLSEREINLVLSPEAKEFLVNVGYDSVYGARPLKRAIQRYIEDPLAEELLRGDIESESEVLVVPEGEKLTFISQKKETQKV